MVSGTLTSDAIQEFADALGREHVIDHAAALEQAATATFTTTSRVPLIVRPGNRAEVQAAVGIANRHRIAIYPISTGKNWGYGSKVPASDGNVILDLGRMNRIVDFSEDLAYVTVEPGVTQGQLYAFLRDQGSRLWMDASGASPECSLIGNAMERGFGHTPYGDHFANACAFEVVLPTGECIETGFSRFPNGVTAPVYRWGLGPTFDGLFTQSNFGIVTRMTIWLMPAPERFEAYFFRCDDDAGLAPMVDALRRLRLNGTVRSAVHIGNDYKVLNGLRQYPWEETGGRTPLTRDLMTRFRKDLRIGAWNASGGLYGTKAQVAESRRLLRAGLKGHVQRLEFLGDAKLALARRFAGVYGMFTGWDLSATLDLLAPLYGLMQGVPTRETLASSYWRKRNPPPPTADMDPDTDGCGLLWCAPVTPLEGRHAERLTRISIDLLLEHGFEPLLSLTTVAERALTCVVSISYDRDVEGEDARALACYRALLTGLAAEGYHSYRLGIQSLDSLTKGGAYDDFLARLKQTLDPNGILAPGRYGIA